MKTSLSAFKMIVGVTGPICAGKGRVVDEFKKLGFVHHSFSAEIRQVAKERGIEINRLSLSKLGHDLRRESPRHSILASRVLAHIHDDMKRGSHRFVVEGMRDFDELFMFREHELEKPDMRFILIGVDAPQELRWKRLKKRARHGDPRTFGEFKRIDDWELSGRGGQEVARCMKMADYMIVNDSTLPELKRKVKGIFREII
ncbi:AAA family ATPase [Candidatus Woesearchaeota archaeon]|nr:AAA family ATPase [Candidatus Woesearchaeota archaeon]